MANNHKEFKIRVVFVDPSEIPDEDRSRMEEAKKELDKGKLKEMLHNIADDIELNCDLGSSTFTSAK